jgi:hypothetical protein
MKKGLIIAGIVIAVLAAGLYYYTQVYTKSFSPLATTDFSLGSAKLQVVYCQPSKRGREIFGKLVPFGRTWRTGANEPTTFETSADVMFGDKVLKAGKYSLWTVPDKESWQVVFSNDIPSWGINFDGLAQRDASTDALILEVPTVKTDQVFEQFNISMENVDEGAELILAWDQTMVAVPFSVK